MDFAGMFESLTNSLGSFFSKIRLKGRKLTEADVREGMRTVRMALLEADVALPVVREFIERVTVKAVGQDVLQAVEPSQQLVKIVHDELIALMGPGETELARRAGGPSVYMLVGLQGTGKTTCAAKLAMRSCKLDFSAFCQSI